MNKKPSKPTHKPTKPKAVPQKPVAKPLIMSPATAKREFDSLTTMYEKWDSNIVTSDMYVAAQARIQKALQLWTEAKYGIQKPTTKTKKQ